MADEITKDEHPEQVTQTIQSPEDIKRRLESLVKRETQWFERDHNKIVLFARQVPILVLGDHSNEEGKAVVDAVIRKLTVEMDHSAIPLKNVSRSGGNHIHCERRAMRRYPIIIKLDGSKPGTIGENVLIACDMKCQEKAFLFVKENPETLERVFTIEHFYLYFPRIYFCKGDNDMIEKATRIAVREAYRLAYMSCDDKDMQSRILNTDDNSIVGGGTT